MITVGITGIDGLIGWHLHAFLHGVKDVRITGANRGTFASEAELEGFVSDADVIVHLAGVNRGGDRELEESNIRLTQALIDAAERSNSQPHILFASSIHIARNSAYGRSKRQCADLLRSWAIQNDALFTNMILPHLFGEGGKPFYNSVVSTFCYQLAHGESPRIDHDGQLELLHAQQLTSRILELIRQPVNNDLRVHGQAMTVSELLARLQEISRQYQNQIIPDLSAPLDTALFNTYRSYLFPDYYPVAIPLHEDERGSLFEATRSLNPGQSFISYTKPAVTRGNHYHRAKVERFLVIQGEAVIRIRKLFSDKITEFTVCGGEPVYIDMPTLHTHNIANTGDGELVTLFWAHEIFDPNRSDTFMETV